MSELHIRINKRVAERIVWLLIVIVLAVLLLTSSPSSGVPQEQVENYTSQIDALTSENQNLSSQVESLEQQLADLEEQNEQLAQEASEPEPTPEPEEQLSGEIGIDWSVRMTDDDALERVIIVFENGLESTQELEYTLVWDGSTFRSNGIDVSDSVVVRSGESEQVSITDYVSNPGEDIDTLILEVRDSDGELVDQLEKRVR